MSESTQCLALLEEDGVAVTVEQTLSWRGRVIDATLTVTDGVKVVWTGKDLARTAAAWQSKRREAVAAKKSPSPPSIEDTPEPEA